MSQAENHGWSSGVLILLSAAMLSANRAPAQERPQTERAASVFADYETMDKGVTKLVKAGNEVKVGKELARWGKDVNDEKDQRKKRIATRLLICSWGLSSVQGLLEGNLLNNWQAATTSILCLKPDAAMILVNSVVKRPGSSVGYGDLLLWQANSRKWLADDSSYSIAESLVAAGADPNLQTTITSYAPRGSITINGVTRQEEDIVYPEGPTPLYYAILYGNSKGVEFLLKHGADKTRKFRVEAGRRAGHTGLGEDVDIWFSRTVYELRTPVEFACSSDNKEICALLK